MNAENSSLLSFSFAWLFGLMLSTPLVAQHADIRFSYNESDSIVIRDGIVGFTDGFQIFESTFPISGFSIRFTENPGFLAEIANGDMLVAGDSIFIEVLESAHFGSYLTYYDPILQDMAPTLATISIEDNGGVTSDLVVANTMLSGDNPQFIQTANANGEIHSHIDFALSAEAAFGAFGFLFQLNSSNPAIESSPPVWLVFNYGMSPGDFDQFAIPAFVGTEFLLGDVNGDGEVSLLDVSPFVSLVTSGGFLPAADINDDGVISLLDVQPFVNLLTGG